MINVTRESRIEMTVDRRQTYSSVTRDRFTVTENSLTSLK